ncbi:MAG TPA: type I DNA topoisomerase [bacterium]|nr:type I DNA topoisomerase [bacterium]
MPKSLVIVESPAKAKTINKYLGRDYVVKASMGHVKDLPKSKLGVDLENDFEPTLTTIRGKAKVIKELREAAKKVERIYLATDLDREGEAIASHLADILEAKDKETFRVTFNEITKTAIQEAFRDPGHVDRNKVDAQMARRILDRLVGYLVSPLLWKVITYGTSAGRVQTVALRLICEREAEIEAFKPEEYWSIDATYEGDAGQAFTAAVKEVDGEKADISDEKTARTVGERIRTGEHQVLAVEKKSRRRRAQAPFITSTLQQDASRRLGFSTKKTMMLAQQLYEGIDIGGEEGTAGLITYMRTDSVRISELAQGQAREFVTEKWGEEYLPEKPNEYKTKGKAQEAHEAIRPTEVSLTPDRVRDSLSKDQARLYELVWQRFLASQMAPAVVDQTGVDILAKAPGAPDDPKQGVKLRATGSIIRFPGHLAAYTSDKKKADDEGKVLPPIEEGEKLRLVDPGVVEEQHFTQPPPRYSEASLVKTMEEEGIGRPSTYSAIISTLDARKYVERITGRFQPTELGKTVLRVLLRGFPDIFETKFTARMEEELDRIEAGDDPWVRVIGDFYGPFRVDLDKVEAGADDLKKELEEKTDKVCEKCGSPMIIKWGRNGRFLACTGYPECRNTAPVDGVQETDEVCEECGAQMVVKEGRFGRFLACSKYPDCRYTKSIGLGVKCPKPGCGGEIVPRRAKKSGRTFYGCNKYPDCDFVTWDRPVDSQCENCGNPYMVEKVRSSGSVLRCPECKAESVAA